MKTASILAGVAALLASFATVCQAASPDITSSRRADLYMAGRHRFYIWCAAGTDRIAYQHGVSAEDAKLKLVISERAVGQPGCEPVWRGRINS